MPELRRESYAERNDVMGEALLSRGYVMQEDGSNFRELVGAYFVHPDDVLGVELTSDNSRLNGCCALDGCDGPNLRCRTCQEYVATRITDCWRSHCVLFDRAATRAELIGTAE